jgi:hypothetical protein
VRRRRRRCEAEQLEIAGRLAAIAELEFARLEAAETEGEPKNKAVKLYM